MHRSRGHLACLAILLGAVILGGGGAALADEGDAPEIEARRLAHILGYVEADYRNAVSDGAVIHEAEYNEQLALLDDAATIAVRLDRAGATKALLERVREVRAPVVAKSREADVKAAIAAVRAAIMRTFKIDDAPTKRPDRARGEALFGEHCATCHGVTGRGDTARAKTLAPPPTDFHDPAVGEGLSPHRVATTVQFGIAGTAMIPFTFLNEEDRWNLAFYSVSLRHIEKVGAGGAPGMSLAELAMATDGEILDDLYATGAREEELPGILALLRARAPYEESGGSLVAARASLERAERMLSWGEREQARETLGEAYTRGIRPAFGTIRAAGVGVAGDLEARLLDVHSKVAEGDLEVLQAKVDSLRRALLAADPKMVRAIGGETSGTSIKYFVCFVCFVFVMCSGEAVAAAIGIGAAIARRRGRSLRKKHGSGRSKRRMAWRIAAVAALCVAALDVTWTILGLPSLRAAAPGIAIGGAVLVATAATLALSPRILPHPYARRLARAALVLSAAIFIARGVAWLELAGALPTHSTGLPSITWLGIHPTIEVIAAIVVILALPIAARMIRRRRARQDPARPAT
jgi:high-affinity iron transporter